ncbi:MAG: site-specific integrase, partial [Acinetobacter sp.]
MSFEQNAATLLAMWLKERKIQNQSEHTLQAYERDVSDFMQFCATRNLPLADVETSDLREYLAHKVERFQLSSSSLQRMLSAIRQFMKWAEQGEYMSFNPADDFQLKRQSRPLPGLVDIETVNQILDQPEPESEIQQQMWLRD